ncbi:MAG: hypothetical protein E5V40_32240, partial [Mesorhizobium sp.]
MPVLMASLGTGIIIENLIQIIANPDVRILSYPALTQVVTIGFLRIRALDIAVAVLFAAIAIAMDLFLNRAPILPVFISLCAQTL